MQTAFSLTTAKIAKELTDDYIQAFCQRRSKESLEISPAYYRLWQSIESLILAGGKRLRPYMVLVTYQAYNPQGSLDDVLPAAVAQELIHSAMLIHDDIIDRDDIRYGVKNISGQYDEYYQQYIHDKTERTHMSLSAALLAGDGLISDAHRLIRKTNRPSELVEQADEILNRVIFEVIGGELLDTEITFLPKGSISVDAISKYKTASYSFAGPLTTGAVLAQAPENDVQVLKEFSVIIGTGYQLRDDLLGTFGDEKITGKSTITDIQEGKRTYLIEQFEHLATEAQKETFFSLFCRQDTTSDELEEAKKLLIASGAQTAVEDLIQKKYNEALAKINQLDLPREAKSVYESLVEQCLYREL